MFPLQYQNDNSMLHCEGRVFKPLVRDPIKKDEKLFIKILFKPIPFIILIFIALGEPGFLPRVEI